jgi:hypothetical protein
MIFNATLNNVSAMSWRLVLLVEGGNPKKPVVINFHTYSCIEYTSLLAGFELAKLVVIGTDFTGS